jgi:hypothetical protein
MCIDLLLDWINSAAEIDDATGCVTSLSECQCYMSVSVVEVAVYSPLCPADSQIPTDAFTNRSKGMKFNEECIEKIRKHVDGELLPVL